MPSYYFLQLTYHIFDSSFAGSFDAETFWVSGFLLLTWFGIYLHRFLSKLTGF